MARHPQDPRRREVTAVPLPPCERRTVLRVLAGALAMAAGLPRADAAPVQLIGPELVRDAEGVLLGFSVRFELPSVVEDALMRGVPLYFVADATLYASRWYWRDRPVAHATRTWRLAWQPLTRSYRVSFGALNQTYETLADALGAVRGAARWRIAEPAQLESGADYVDFRWRLDTSQLPRPMQIGLAGQDDWSLDVERSAPLP